MEKKAFIHKQLSELCNAVEDINNDNDEVNSEINQIQALEMAFNELIEETWKILMEIEINLFERVDVRLFIFY